MNITQKIVTTLDVILKTSEEQILSLKRPRHSKSMRWVLFYTVMPSKFYDEILVLPIALYFHFMLPFSRFLNEEVGKLVK